MTDIQEVGEQIFQIDLQECGYIGRTAGYLVGSNNAWMLIETGPTSSSEVILEAFKQIGVGLDQVKYIGVTHIHMDHAGGLGTMAKHIKGSQAVVHPKGARHMVDPARLIAGSLEFWGEEKMRQYGEVIPVPENRVIHATDGEKIDLNGRDIEVWSTPGHCKNHICFFDTKTSALFSGDSAGVFSPKLSHLLDRPVVRPATPPPDFDFESMFNSLFRMAINKIKHIYFTHYGKGMFSPKLLLEIVLGQIVVYMEMANIYCEGYDQSSISRDDILSRLQSEMEAYLQDSIFGPGKKLENQDPLLEQDWSFQVDMIKNSAAGILNYLEKKR